MRAGKEFKELEAAADAFNEAIRKFGEAVDIQMVGTSEWIEHNMEVMYDIRTELEDEDEEDE